MEVTSYLPKVNTFNIEYNDATVIIPDEIILDIFSYLNKQDLGRLSQVSTRLKAISEDFDIRKVRKVCSKMTEDFEKTVKKRCLEIFGNFSKHTNKELRYIYIKTMYEIALLNPNILTIENKRTIDSYYYKIKSILEEMQKRNLKIHEVVVSKDKKRFTFFKDRGQSWGHYNDSCITMMKRFFVII